MTVTVGGDTSHVINVKPRPGPGPSTRVSLAQDFGASFAMFTL